MRQVLAVSRGFGPTAQAYFTESVRDDVGQNCALGSIVESLGGATSAQVTMQESPSPDTVNDATALWFDLIVLAAQNAIGALKGTNVVPRHSRTRLKVTTVGAGTPVLTVVLEGQGKLEGDK